MALFKFDDSEWVSIDDDCVDINNTASVLDVGQYQLIVGEDSFFYQVEKSEDHEVTIIPIKNSPPARDVSPRPDPQPQPRRRASVGKQAACVAGTALGTALMVAGTAACLTGAGIPVGAFLLVVGKVVLSLFAAMSVVGTTATVASGVVAGAGAVIAGVSLYGLFGGKPSAADIDKGQSLEKASLSPSVFDV